MREETKEGVSLGAARIGAHRPRPDARADRFPDSVETGWSWVAAALAIGILSISYGGPLIVVVGLKPIAAALGSDRSVIALAAALVWVGTGSGGILMGWVADRIGVRRTVVFGALMTALGLAVSAVGKIWTLYLGHALLIGFLGGGALYPPLLIYVSRWFDRRRGAALALISSGQYIAGVIWPTVFQHWLGWFGWQSTMLCYALVVMAMAPLALFLRPALQPGRATRSAKILDARRPGIGVAAQYGAGIAVRGVVFVLRADGDAGRAPGGDVQRSRDLAGAECGDAVGAARLRLCQSPVLGLARRPDRRARHRLGRLGLSGVGDRCVLGDQERDRAVRGLGGLRPRL